MRMYQFESPKDMYDKLILYKTRYDLYNPILGFALRTYFDHSGYPLIKVVFLSHVEAVDIIRTAMENTYYDSWLQYAECLYFTKTWNGEDGLPFFYEFLKRKFIKDFWVDVFNDNMLLLNNISKFI